MALKALGLGQLVAPTGKFRAVIVVDSEPYQIDDDADTIPAAMRLCLAAQKSEHDVFQIFDDKGRGCIKGKPDETCVVPKSG